MTGKRLASDMVEYGCKETTQNVNKTTFNKTFKGCRLYLPTVR